MQERLGATKVAKRTSGVHERLGAKEVARKTSAVQEWLRKSVNVTRLAV